MSATILYLDTAPDGRIQTATLAGIRRYAASLRCEVVDVPPADSRPANIASLLAARFPGSRSLFQLRFREAMGHSVLDEILHVRLEKVLTLLSQTDTAIGAISGLCGFRTDRALDSLFHSRFGMSMQEWRRRNGRVRP